MNRVAFSSFALSAQWVVMSPVLISHVPLALSFESGLQFILSQALPMNFTPWHQQIVECEQNKCPTYSKNLEYATSQLAEGRPLFENNLKLKCLDTKGHLFILDLVLSSIQSWFITAYKALITSQALVVFPRALIVILFSFGKWRSMLCHEAPRNGLAISFTLSVVKSMLKSQGPPGRISFLRHSVTDHINQQTAVKDLWCCDCEVTMHGLQEILLGVT